ncbi:unnamed protein product, partial (macronuclear) [Paramecium tetraurelia]
MVSDYQSWGFSEFNLNVVDTTYNILKLVNYSFSKRIFSTISVDDGWMTNNIVSQQVDQCTDFNFLRSTGNNFIKEFVLNFHNRINLNLKVLIFNQVSPIIDFKIDNQKVVAATSDSYVQSSIPLCQNFRVMQVSITDFMHNSKNLRIEVTTSTDGSTSWFGIRDFSLFTNIFENFQCKDFNIQPFDGCFSNQYDCNLGCSNCVNGICINCLDDWYLDTKNNCIPICGDQKFMLNEVCDDGNSIPYDGCHDCQFSCPLNCILCVYGTCKECEKSYFLVKNRCKHGFQFDQNLFEQLETGFFSDWTNYLEKNGLLCYQNLVEKLRTGFFNNWTNYLETNDFQCENLIKQLETGFSNNWTKRFDKNNFQIENLVEQLETGIFNNWTNYLEKNDFKCYQIFVKQLAAGFFNYWTNYLEKNDFQCENLIIQIEPYFYNNWTNQLEKKTFNVITFDWTNYLEKNGFQCQPNSQQQSILQFSQQYNLLQNNYHGLNIIQSFSVCYFPDSLIIQDYQSNSQTECREGYKFSPNTRQCVEMCNCKDLVSLQNNDCYNCIQNCSSECLVCILDKCYACLEGWQLIEHKCQQICGDNQVALTSNEQCDDGNHIIEDGCNECLFQCRPYCQFCNKELNCLICESNFKLVHHLCAPICGDKIVISGLEECDDGNDIKYDGCFECQFQCNFGCKICESGKCQDVCKVEEEFINVLIESEEIDPNQSECKNHCLVCDGANCLRCKPDYILENNKCFSCGNGIITKDEECDDGNRINSDGCSNQCKIEEDWNCIDSFSFLSQCFPIAKISIVFLNSTYNTQYVKLSYTKKVKLNQQDIHFLDFNANSINIDPTYYIVYYFNINITPVIEIVSNDS